jgi:hypothetical protein
MFRGKTLPGIGLPPPMIVDHERRLRVLEEHVSATREDVSFIRGQIDAFLRRASSRPPARAGVKTIGAVVGALGAVVTAYAAARGWL